MSDKAVVYFEVVFLVSVLAFLAGLSYWAVFIYGDECPWLKRCCECPEVPTGIGQVDQLEDIMDSHSHHNISIHIPPLNP